MTQSHQAKTLDNYFYPVSNKIYNRYERIVEMVKLEEELDEWIKNNLEDNK